MSHLQQLSTLLWQQADGLSVVLNGLFQDQVFLQQLQCARLVLVGGGNDTRKEDFQFKNNSHTAQMLNPASTCKSTVTKED